MKKQQSIRQLSFESEHLTNHYMDELHSLSSEDEVCWVQSIQILEQATMQKIAFGSSAKTNCEDRVKQQQQLCKGRHNLQQNQKLEDEIQKWRQNSQKLNEKSTRQLEHQKSRLITQPILDQQKTIIYNNKGQHVCQEQEELAKLSEDEIETLEFSVSMQFLQVSSKTSQVQQQETNQQPVQEQVTQQCPCSRQYALSQDPHVQFLLELVGNQTYLRFKHKVIQITPYFIQQIPLYFIANSIPVPIPAQSILNQTFHKKFISLYLKHLHNTDHDVLYRAISEIKQQKAAKQKQNTIDNCQKSWMSQLANFIHCFNHYSKAELLKSHVLLKYQNLLRIQKFMSEQSKDLGIESKKGELEEQLCVLEMAIGFERTIRYCQEQERNKKQMATKKWQQLERKTKQQFKDWLAKNDVSIKI